VQSSSDSLEIIYELRQTHDASGGALRLQDELALERALPLSLWAEEIDISHKAIVPQMGTWELRWCARTRSQGPGAGAAFAGRVQWRRGRCVGWV
jgi:hypothetical protein